MKLYTCSLAVVPYLTRGDPRLSGPISQWGWQVTLLYNATTLSGDFVGKI